MQKLKLAPTALVLIGILGNLHPSQLPGQGGLREFREVHLGMEVRVVLEVEEQESAAQSARRAFDRIDSLDLIMSDWRPASELSLLTHHPPRAWVPVSGELAVLLMLARDIAERTDGAFDPTVGPLTQLWRAERSSGIASSDSAWAEARSRVGWHWLDIDTVAHRVRFDRRGMRLDLGAIAKGWILDAAARQLRRDGVTRFLIEAGGDLIAGEAPTAAPGWRIRIERDSGDTLLHLRNAALSTSGPSAQSLAMADGTSASHVIDLGSGRGSTSPLQVTVVGRQAVLTDAMATALTLVPRERWDALLAAYSVELVATVP